MTMADENVRTQTFFLMKLDLRHKKCVFFSGESVAQTFFPLLLTLSLDKLECLSLASTIFLVLKGAPTVGVL